MKQLAKQMRLKALEMAFKSGKNGSHLGGGLSAVEILAVLYDAVMKYNAADPYDENRDRLILSKGHCVLAYYTALNYAGFLSDEELDTFETNGSHYHGHAPRDIEKGIDFSGGSLSMGMSFAVGQALGCKKKGLNNRVFTIVGDGECDEGLIWESAMSASNFKLNNLVVIIDCNKLQYDGPTSEVMNHYSLEEKFKSFGFDVLSVDGHNCDQLRNALLYQSDKPLCVVANTIKGKGVSFMEGNKEWHHHTLTGEQYEQALKEVNL